MEPWLHRFDAGLLSLAVGVLMMGAAAFGARRAGRLRPLPGRDHLSAVETGLFGLLALLLAFTFSGAAARFDARGALMIDAANALKGVILRADLYPPPLREAFRNDLRDYLAQQIALYDAERDDAALKDVVARSDAIQQKLWARAVQGAADPAHNLASAQMLPALDRLFGLAASRQAAARTHIPGVIIMLLFVMAVATAYTSGYAAGATGAFSTAGYLGFSLLTALVIYVTLDLDQPGRGIIRRSVQEQAFISLRPALQMAEPQATGR